jgi:hypothetical protein
VLLLSGTEGFTLLWVWYISVAAVFVQLTMNLLLLRREFRSRLIFAAGSEVATQPGFVAAQSSEG